MGILFILLFIPTLLTAQHITIERKTSNLFKDTLAVRWLDPKFGEFPDASLIDFSFLLDPPAGKFGFVKVGKDGHFYFERTNKRIRFWGVTIAGSHVDIPKERIRTVIEILARAGCNIIRLHELDNRGSEKFGIVRRNIIDESHPNENNSRTLDKEYLDRVDYWIYQAQKHGIYVYLVLRAYRMFKTGDGIEGAEKMDRKGSPYGLFDERMIELQKEFIDNFLFKHINPYTGIPNGLNPAVAMIELINEDSFFFQYDKLDEMIEPYRTKFTCLWVQFLRQKYVNTENLKRAWATKDGFSILGDDESLEEGWVYFPKLRLRSFDEFENGIGTDIMGHPLRVKDGVEFLMSLQIKLFKDLKEFIRSRGCPIPLTATVNSEFISDTYTVASELDFIGQNMYMDHPFFEPGNEWVGVSFFRNENYLRKNDRWAFPVYSSFYAWEKKPVVIREWALCYPNEYRVSSLIQVAVYSLLQDYDAVIYFAFYTWGDVNVCSPFGLQSDPTRWGLFGYAAKIFINAEIKPFPEKVNVCFYPDDLKIFVNWWNEAYKLSYNFILRNKILKNDWAPSSNEINILAKDVFNGGFKKLIDSLIKIARDEIKIDFVGGVLLVNSKTFKAISGQMDTLKIYELGNFRIRVSSPISAILILSVDGLPLDSSNKIAVKFVTVAKNRGQVFEKVSEGRFALRNQGSAPVQTYGEKSNLGVEISKGGKSMIKSFMKNGSFEIVIDKLKRQVFVFCDTPNIKFEINPEFFRFGKIVKFYQEIGGEDYGRVFEGGIFVYPGYSKYVMIY